jgi:hypothetical protein
MPENEDLKKWLGRIEVAKHYQSEYGNQKLAGVAGGGGADSGRWDIFNKALAGDFNSQADLGDDAIDVNMIYSLAKTVLPPLWVQQAHFTFTPTTARAKYQRGELNNIRRAEYAELEVNHWFRELKVRTEVQRPCVIDAEACNHGYALVGYLLAEDKAEVENKDGEVTEPSPYIRLKQPFVRRLSPKRVLLPPGFTSLEDCEWVAIHWTKLLSDVQERYDAPKLESNRQLGSDIKKKSGSLASYLNTDDAKLIDIYEIWDKRTKKIYVVAENYNEGFLDEQDWTIEFDGFPLVDLTFNDIPDEYYGTPPIQYTFTQNKELNATRTAMGKRFRKTKAVIFGSGESGDLGAQYNEAEDGGYIKTELGSDQPIRNHIMPDPGLPPDQTAMAYEQSIKSDLIETSGLSAEQRGGGDPNVDSATSSANVEKHAQIRATDKGDRVRDFMVDIARKLWMVLQQFPNEKRSRLVAGNKAGQFREVTYSLSEIRGEFNIKLDMSTVMPDTQQNRLAAAMTNYNLMRVDPLVNPNELLLDIFRAQNKPSPEQYLLELRDPEDELQMMMQGLPVEPHERDDHEHHSQVHDAQAQQLEEELDRTDEPDSDIGRKLRITLILVESHANAHAMELQKIAAANGQQAGTPLDVNSARNSQAASSGAETEAELRGNPL